ncbi:MAG: hypothetical protein ACYTAF_02235 [Planctomycetota bacterium]|jgi:hypothetical protein
MCPSTLLCEVRYPDRFLRDLARRLNFVTALARRCEVPKRFLDDLERALDEARKGRAGVPAR